MAYTLKKRKKKNTKIKNISPKILRFMKRECVFICHLNFPFVYHWLDFWHLNVGRVSTLMR